MNKELHHVLLVDDDPKLCQLLEEYLRGEGFAVSSVSDGVQAVEQVRQTASLDVMVLDIMMPRLSGLEVLQQVRQISALPVIMLTGKGDDIDRIIGLEMGADDYLAKPCNPRELSARIKAVLRRSQAHAPPPVARDTVSIAAGLRLDPQSFTAHADGKLLQLTAAEFRVLQLLMERAGEILSKAHLTEQVLQRKLAHYDRSIDVHVSRVRQKLQAAGVNDPIKTIRGMGYQFTVQAGDNDH